MLRSKLNEKKNYFIAYIFILYQNLKTSIRIFFFFNYYYFQTKVTLTYECLELINFIKPMFGILFGQDMNIKV